LAIVGNPAWRRKLNPMLKTSWFVLCILLAVSCPHVVRAQATVNPAAKQPDAPPLRPKPEARPGWWNEAVFYQVFVRSFADSREGPLAGDGIGDIAGLIERLDYLNDNNPQTTTDLGVTALWLMPMTQSPSYHGYDTTDYRTIEADYGTNEDFQRLMAACKARGIRVIVDLVLNHCSSKHPWFAEATAPGSAKRDWFIWADANPGYKGPWNQTVWHRSRANPRLGFYYGIFNDDMPDLNYENAAVSEEMMQTCEFWLTELKVDGFRLDAVRHLIEDGATQDSTAATHAWLRQFAKRMRAAKSDVFNVGEVWASTATAAAYVHGQDESEMDSCFEFDLAGATLGAVNSGNAAPLAKQLELTWRSFPDNQFSTFLANHDQTRVMTTLKGDMNKARLAAGLLLSLPGIPFIYYGEELGMSGDKPDPKLRTPMQWTASPIATKSEPTALLAPFTTGKPWQTANSDGTRVNAVRQTNDRTSLLSWYRTLVALRRTEPALLRGGYAPVTSTHPSVLAFIRTLPADVAQEAAADMLILVNLSADPVEKYTLTGRQTGLRAGRTAQAELTGGEKLEPFAIGQQGEVVDITPIKRLRPLSINIISLK